MRIPYLLVASVAASVATSMVNAVGLTYTFSTCASFSCTAASDTILSFTSASGIVAPPDPGVSSVSAPMPLSGLAQTAGSFTGATVSTYHFGSRLGSTFDFAGLTAADGVTYSFGGFPVEISSVTSSPTDLPLLVGIGNYNGLGIFQCVDAACDAVRSGVVSPVLLAVTETSGSAMPEPASWVLFIGGFGLVGGAMRRRSKVSKALAVDRIGFAQSR